MPASTLYICYFGLREPLVQTQVLPYLRELIKDGTEVTLLTFEPEFKRNWDEQAIAAARDELSAAGIEWKAAGYHKWPSVPATALDILNGARIVRRLISRKQFDIVHGRVLVPVIMALIARGLSRHKPKIIYDMRGFFAEEYTDAGIWPEGGSIYRAAKRTDTWSMKEADGFVVLTEKARSILFPESQDTGKDRTGRPVEVIPCCIDPDRFEAANEATRNETRNRLGVADRTVIAYVGSFGGWYMSDEMFDLFNAAREADPNVFMIILTQRDSGGVRQRLTDLGFAASDVLVDTVTPAEVPRYLAAADMAVSLIKPCYSKQASSPTKIAEYLACGLPIISNRGIGDVDELITEDNVGVLLDRFDRDAYIDAIRRIKELGDINERCRTSAKERFDLVTVGGDRYRRLYKRLLQS